MTTVQEYYAPIPMAADSTLTRNDGTRVAGFLAKVSGTITVATVSPSVTIVDAVPVTAGVYTPIPFSLPGKGFVVTLAGGAAGTLAI